MVANSEMNSVCYANELKNCINVVFLHAAAGLSCKTVCRNSVLWFTAAYRLSSLHSFSSCLLKSSRRGRRSLSSSGAACVLLHVFGLLLLCGASDPLHLPPFLRYQCSRPYYSQQDASHTEGNEQKWKKKRREERVEILGQKHEDWSWLKEYFLEEKLLKG